MTLYVQPGWKWGVDDIVCTAGWKWGVGDIVCTKRMKVKCRWHCMYNLDESEM